MTLGMPFSLSASASAYASLYNEQIETDQLNSQSFSSPDWAATTSDHFTVATVGVDLADVTAQLEDEGVSAFSKSFDELLATLQDEAQKL